MRTNRLNFDTTTNEIVKGASVVPVSLKTSANSKLLSFAEQLKDFGLDCFQTEINDLVNKYLGSKNTPILKVNIGNQNTKSYYAGGLVDLPVLTDQELLMLVASVLDGHGSNS